MRQEKSEDRSSVNNQQQKFENAVWKTSTKITTQTNTFSAININANTFEQFEVCCFVQQNYFILFLAL